MICPQCGYMQADEQIPCRRCGHIFARSSQRPSSASVVDFPGNRSNGAKANGMRGPVEVHTTTNVPAWRAELSARVRQIKARRSMEAELEAAMQEHQKSLPPPAPPVITVTPEIVEPAPVELTIEAVTPEMVEDEKGDNPIVRAMLNRVKRASENSKSVEIPSVPRSRPATRTTSPLIVTTATAPAEINAPMASVALQEAVAPQPILQEVKLETATVTEPLVSAGPNDLDTAFDTLIGETDSEEIPDTMPVKNLGLLDDFESEFEHSLDQAFVGTLERPEIVERLRAGAMDLAIIGLSNIPLVAAVELVNGDFSDFRVKAILVAAAAMVASIYLFSTLTVAGQTIGMMSCRLRVVDVHTGQQPNVVQSLLRTFGCLVSCVTLMAGFVWTIFDRNQRGLHEHISRTQVVKAGF
ncbi:MAG: RDD family protein [Blastocatellia bacterium]|nr:RDD family protein [Blastocatellia bacterium]